MRVIDIAEIPKLAPMPRLIECLREAFGKPFVAPGRRIEPIPGGQGDRILGYMPVFDSAGIGAVKLITAFPENAERGRPRFRRRSFSSPRQAVPLR